jgi:L-alanine-DL-glutamate epimerase-like enolase superfamily enzyme
VADAPRIAAVETATVSLTANRALTVNGARGTHADSSFVLVRVSTEDGVAGHGEISATPLWSGEDDATATHCVRNLLRPVLVGQPLESVAALGARMDRVLAGNPFTKAGVNMALWDALGRSVGLPVVRLLGGPFRDRVPIKMSLSGDGDVLAGSLTAARERGVAAYKVKVGIDLRRDLERFALARELVGDDAFLGADANGGWTRTDAARALPRLAEHGAAFAEQPLPADDVEGLARLRGRGLPIVADESVFSLGDVARVVRADAADVVSVYVGKSGGLERALLAARTLAVFGVDALLGSNGEMGLGAAAQLHVACACERLSSFPSDIIGQLYYDEDTLREPVRIDGRHAHLPGGPGLGVEPSAEIAARFA